MSLLESIRLAFTSLCANKLRAGLTMLGIMIGVAAVITLLSIGDGVNRYVADQFVGLGTNLLFIVPADDPDLTESSLTLHDARLLADPAVVPDIVAVAPVVFRSGTLEYGRAAYRTSVRPSTPSYGQIRGYEVQRGRFITEADDSGRSRVVVLGSETVRRLFPDGLDPLEEEVKINGVNFRVIGILREKGASAFGSQDDLAIVPITTAQDRLYDLRSPRTGRVLVDVILAQAVTSQAVNDVLIDTGNALRQSHNINFRADDDFLILTQQDFLSAFGQVTGVLTLFLGAIAGISLLVGGIGIMNIMLVSVTERTREIGLRKAVGARRSDILGQFLTEAILFSLLGGLAGVALGVLGASAVHLAVPELDTSVTTASMLLAVSFSAAVGLFFGLYPAARAAALRPIDALRFE